MCSQEKKNHQQLKVEEIKNSLTYLQQPVSYLLVCDGTSVSVRSLLFLSSQVPLFLFDAQFFF